MKKTCVLTILFLFLLSSLFAQQSVAFSDESSIVYPDRWWELQTTLPMVGTMTDSRDGRTYKTKETDSSKTFIDSRDGTTYNIVEIGTQVWMAENLAYKPSNGKYSENSNNNESGYLYDWGTAKQVCPSGWHLPEKDEFITLVNNYGGLSFSYPALMPGGESGFSVLLGDSSIVGFWSASYDMDRGALYLGLESSNKYVSILGYHRSWMFSVRCLQGKSSGKVKITCNMEGVLTIGDDFSQKVKKGDVVEKELDGGEYTVKLNDWSKTFFLENKQTEEFETDSEKDAQNNTPDVLNKKTLTDKLHDSRDGKDYKTIGIGNQVWMAENLAFKANKGCWIYEDDQDKLNKYGYLYDWTTAQQVCPDGWHLPSDEDWMQLEINLGMSRDEASYTFFRGTIGNELKNTSGWYDERNGSNSSGFSALPGGYSLEANMLFVNIGDYGYWWTSTEKDSKKAWFRALNIGEQVFRIDMSKRAGLSVRCLQDN